MVEIIFVLILMGLFVTPLLLAFSLLYWSMVKDEVEEIIYSYKSSDRAKKWATIFGGPIYWGIVAKEKISNYIRNLK